VPAAVAAFCRRHPSAGVALILSTLDPKLMLEAMRAGVTECVAEPITAKGIEEAVRRIAATAHAEPAGQVLAFVGAKGGVGTSTLAVNAAASLARASKTPVLLVDLHLGYGDDALFLGVEPRFSVLDALENVQRIDQSFLSGVVEKTAGGIHLLSSGAKTVHAPIEGPRMRALLESASQSYRLSVLDVPRASVMTLDSLDAASAIVVVTTQEVSAVRSAGQLAETLRHRYGTARVHVAINRFSRDTVISAEDVERVTVARVKHRIPSDYNTAIEALNAGTPFVIDPKTRLGSSVSSMARDLAGLATKERPAAQGMLTRLVFRRA
jgi:pilus assembly protein CpaE